MRPRLRRISIVALVALALLLQPMPAPQGKPIHIALPRLHVNSPAEALRAIPAALAFVPKAIGALGGGAFRAAGSLFASNGNAAAAPTTSPSPLPITGAPGEIISMRARDAKYFRNPDGTTRAEFGKYLHYESSPGRWEDVNLNFRADGPDHVADRHDIIVRVTPTALIGMERGSGKGIRWLLPSPATVAGRKASFVGQGGMRWNYHTTTSGVKLLTDPIAASRGPQTYAFAYQLLGNAAPFSVDEAGNLVSDAFSVPRAFAIGADGREYPAGAWRVVAGVASFDFDDAGLPAEAFPYTLDPSTYWIIGASADDNRILRYGTTYAPTGGYLYAPTGIRIEAAREKTTNCGFNGNGPYCIRNGFIRWNTGSLPDTATINSAQLKVQYTYVRSDDNRYLTADWYNTGWPIDSADYSASYQTGASGAPGWSIPATGGIQVLNLTGVSSVSKTSYTGVRLHVSGLAPSGTNQVSIISFDDVDPNAIAPRLIVVYDNVAPTTPVPESPTAGANVPSVTPVLKANSTDANAGDVIYYDFQVASDSGFSTIVADSGWLVGTNTYTVPAGKLRDGQTYYWRAKASDRYTLTGSHTWSASQTFNTRVTKLGSRDYWPMWSHGPVSVNQANGNLVTGVPGPAYPTAAGSMSASASYNSLQAADQGLGAGWTLQSGDDLSPPAKLIDHNALTGTAKFDAVEMVFPDGSTDYYTHVGASNTYVSAPGEGSELKRNTDGSWTLADGGTLYSFGNTAPAGSGAYSLVGAEVLAATAGQAKLTYTFNTAVNPPKVTSVTDGSGRALSFSWNVINPTGCANALLCMTGPDSVAWRYVGDGVGGTTGRLARVHNGTRDLLAITYDGSGRPQKIQNANDLNPGGASPGYDGTHGVTIAYDGSGRVSSVTDGPVTGQQVSANSVWTFAYAPGSVATPTNTRAAHGALPANSGRTADGYATVTPPNQQGQGTPAKTTAYYDNLGRTMEVRDVFGASVLSSYNERDQLEWSEDAEGNPTDNAYDAFTDVLVSTTGPDPDGPSNPLGRPVTTYRYDETAIGTSGSPGPALTGLQASYYPNMNLAGRPDFRRTDATVDANWGTGGPTKPDGGAWRTDQFSVRWTANLTVATAGSYTFSTVADDGTRLTVDGLVAIDDWTDHAVRTTESEPITLSAGLHRIVLEYYENGTYAESHLRWSCELCNPAVGDQVIPTASLAPAWLNQTSTVDPAGNVAFSHFADPASGQADYDLVKVGTDDLVTSYVYDDLGRMTQKVLPKGNVGRLQPNGSLTGSPNLDYATTWTYYGLTETATIPLACGVGTAVAQAGQLKSLQHDGVAAVTTVYDTAGRPVAVTNGAGSTCSTFDAEGRLTNSKAPGESAGISSTFDPAGAVRTVSDGTLTISTDYDEADRVKRSTDASGAESSFAYDADGNRTSRVAATGALASSTNYTTSYAFDEAGRLTSLTDPAGRVYAFSYDVRGSLKTVLYPNSTFSWFETLPGGDTSAIYHRHGTWSQLPSSAPADASPIAEYAYTYDILGRRTQQVRTGGGLATETQTYAYDAAGRLQTATIDGRTLAYEYDLDSNRTKLTDTPSGSPAVVTTYLYDSANAASPGVDQLTSYTTGFSTTTLSHNADGEVTAKGSDSLSWDGRGRMSGGTHASSTVSYGFDPAGRRRTRSASGSLVATYLYAGSEAAIFELDGTGQLAQSSFAGPAGDIARYAGAPATTTNVEYLYFDAHGDLAATADQSGVRTGGFTYDPFGAALGSGAPSAGGTVEGWTGKWDKRLDVASGLIAMGLRPYDPSLGRFIAVDPVVGGSSNNYDYAGQDPINNHDLDGQRKCRGWRKWACRVAAIASWAAVIPGPLGGIASAISAVGYTIGGDWANAGLAYAGLVLWGTGTAVIKGFQNANRAARVARSASAFSRKFEKGFAFGVNGLRSTVAAFAAARPKGRWNRWRSWD